MYAIAGPRNNNKNLMIAYVLNPLDLCYEMSGHETTTNPSDDQMYRIGKLVEVMTTGKV